MPATIRKIILTILLLYLLFIIIGAIVPYAIPKPVSTDYKEEFATHNFYDDASQDRVALVETTQDAFDQRIQMIHNAQKSLDIVYHCVRTGETTDYFFGEILRAADRGVQVRFMLDGTVGGMKSGERKIISYAIAQHPNITYKEYNPITPFAPWRWNTLLHDKFIIADEEVLLLGGRNIGDSYFNPPGFTGGVSNDRDVLVINTGATPEERANSAIYQVQEYMNELWEHPHSVIALPHLSKGKEAKGKEKYESLLVQCEKFEMEHPTIYAPVSQEEYVENTVATNGILLLQNPTGVTKKEPWIGYALQQLGLDAKKSIVIQTPYATGNKDLLQTLAQINENGVNIEMLTNSMGSSPNIPAFSNYISNRKKFVNAGVTIYENQGGRESLHSKSYLVDDHLSIVGSYNLDDRSFYIDTETMLVINSPEFYNIMKETLEGYQEDSLIVGEDNQYLENKDVEMTPVPWPKKLIMWVASIFTRLFQFLI